MNRHITDEQLCSYLDDELDPAARAEVEQALVQDARLKAKLDSWMEQTADLRSALDAELDKPLPDAWLQLAREPSAVQSVPLLPQPRTKALPWKERLMQWMPAPQLAAGMAFSVILGIFVGRHVIPRFDMDEQLVKLASVAHHVYSPDKRQPVEVKSEDPTLTAWISKRLGAQVVAPNVAGYRFMGGRLLAGAEEPAGQFMYEETSGKRLTVFVRTEGAAGRSTDPNCSEYRGVSVCYWHEGGVAYALAGEMPRKNLWTLAQAAASNQVAKP
jgi:anti-sigma factor RsiW